MVELVASAVMGSMVHGFEDPGGLFSKLLAPFWLWIILRHLIFRGTKQNGTLVMGNPTKL